MTPLRKTALIAGVLYLMTFIFSIPVKFWLWDDVTNNPDFVLGAGGDGGVLWGAIFEVITALAGIGTAVALYSVARRYSERAALGFVTARVMEAAVIFVGVLSVLSLFTLREDVAGTAGADSASLLTTGHALTAIHDWTFLIGPGLFPVINALCLGTVMYRSRLVPRIIPTIGLIGAPLLLGSGVATLFGAFDQVSAPAGLLALPIAAWEFSVGVWMTFKGFKTPEPIGDTILETVPATLENVAA
ncbi:MAG: DUF4386 domain-containing protein [Ilumatobacteraceae bacterium]